MRVVSGDARGRRLTTPDGPATRPTTDRVREAIFNVLFTLVDVHEATVVDLFAGSGALGIEALSRGAGHTHFVERDRAAVRCIETNLATLSFADRATVVTSPVERAIAGGVLSGDRATGSVDVLFADPPYAFDDWAALLAAVKPLLAPDAVAVFESAREVADTPGWEKLRVKAYGGTVITFARGVDAPPQP